MDYQRIMKVARGEISAELVLKRAKIINVYSGEIEACLKVIRILEEIYLLTEIQS